MLITNRLIKIHHVIDMGHRKRKCKLTDIHDSHLPNKKKEILYKQNLQERNIRFALPRYQTSPRIREPDRPLRSREPTEPQALEGYRKKYRGFR